MEIIENFWIHGIMPVQFLLLFAFTCLTLIFVQKWLERIGKEFPAFGQVVLLWSTTYLYLKFVVLPPLPFSLFVQYMALITVAMFLWISSTERNWKAFKRPIIATLTGETRTYFMIRAVTFMVLPILTLIGTYHYMKPDLPEAPLSFAAYHPAPPRSITVHGVTYDLQTARNPFRVKD